MAQPGSLLVAQIRELLPTLRGITGVAAKPVLCSQPGRLVPCSVRRHTDAGYDLLTYRKNDAGKDIPDLPGDDFSAASWAWR